MRELVGRVTLLDPEASESLKVIGFFDRLTAARVTVRTLLRGAAELSGTTVGLNTPSVRLRVRPDATDDPGPAEPAAGHPMRELATGGVVWLEREGAVRANDAMVLERLALGLSITADRDESPTARAIEQLLRPDSRDTDEQVRLGACAVLGVDPQAEVRAVAVPPAGSVPAGVPHAVLATPWGVVWGAVATDPAGWTGRVGVGLPASRSSLPESWDSALVVLRLHDGGPDPARADDYGVLLDLAAATDMRAVPPPDVAVLDEMPRQGWSIEALEALASGHSVREIAAAAGLHHSTVQARLPRLNRTLGYEPRTPLGRTRLHAALLGRRLVRTRFG